MNNNDLVYIQTIVFPILSQLKMMKNKTEKKKKCLVLLFTE